MTIGLRITQMLDKTEKDRSKRRNKMLRVIFKMFFVMGLTWTAEMIFWVIEAKFGDYEIFKTKGLLYSGLVFQIINSAQGIIMFLVVYFDTARIKMFREFLCNKSNDKKTSVFYAEDPSAPSEEPSAPSIPSTSVTNVSSRKTSKTSERETNV